MASPAGVRDQLPNEPVAAFADGQVDRSRGARREWDERAFAALAGDRQGPVPAFGPKRFDVGASGFGYSQPVEGHERDQGMFVGGADPGGDEQGADFVAFQAGDVGFVVDPRAADV